MGTPLSGYLGSPPRRRELPAVTPDGLVSPHLLELIEEVEHLPGDLDEAGAGFPDLAVVLSEAGEEDEILAGKGEVALPITAPIGEDGGDVERSVGAVAVWFSAFASGGMYESAPKRGTRLGHLDQRRRLDGEIAESFAQLTGSGHLLLYIDIYTQILERNAGEMMERRKRGNTPRRTGLGVRS
jgi:hypothetical protein